MDNREKIVCRTGDEFEHRSGGKYICVAEDLTPNNAPTLKNLSSGWIFQAHGVGRYDNGTIDWDYSTGGQFDDERLSEYLKERHNRNEIDKLYVEGHSLNFSVVMCDDIKAVAGGIVTDVEDAKSVPEIEEYVKHNSVYNIYVENWNIGEGESIEPTDEQLKIISEYLDKVLDEGECVLLDSFGFEVDDYDDYDEDEDEQGQER